MVYSMIGVGFNTRLDPEAILRACRSRLMWAGGGGSVLVCMGSERHILTAGCVHIARDCEICVYGTSIPPVYHDKLSNNRTSRGGVGPTSYSSPL